MNKNVVSIIVVILVVAVFSSCNKPTIEIDHSVNAIIGDISFIDKFGSKPTRKTNETLRIKTHLEYVEKLLRSKDISALTKKQAQNRQKMLNLLKTYRSAAVFPKNNDFPEKRIPCFIDKDGRICAVGYLIEHTAGRKVADEINDTFKYDYLLAMSGETIDNWIQTSGLTKQECAMIQPAYNFDPQPTQNRKSCMPAIYEGSSLVMSGLNVSFSTINLIQIARGTKSKAMPVIGIITGAGQIALGTIANKEYRTFSKLNIGVGAGTMILSGWNLIANRKPKEKSMALNIYNAPVGDQNVLGFSLTKKL